MFVPASDLTVGSLSVEAKWTVVDAFLGITYKRSMKGKKAAYKWLYIQHGRTHSVKLGIISPFQTLRQEEHVFISQLNPTLSTITWTVWATCPHLISYIRKVDIGIATVYFEMFLVPITPATNIDYFAPGMNSTLSNKAGNCALSDIWSFADHILPHIHQWNWERTRNKIIFLRHH